MLLDEKLVAIAKALDAAGVPYAFGGANALAYYAVPRATLDIDLNVFLPAAKARKVLGVLGRLGASVEPRDDRVAKAKRDEQLRVFWERTPIDLFFSYDPLHASSMSRRRRADFSGDAIYILAAEDLILYKATFDRAKDWRDIAEIVFASPEGLDFDYVRGWLRKIDDEAGRRVEKLERLIRSGGKDLDPGA